MALTAWNRELGSTQGRIAPQAFTPPEGSYAFVLGHDTEGLTQRLLPGDFVEVKQTADFGEAKLVRFRAQVRPPTAVPSGLLWRASVRIDGNEYASVEVTPGRVRNHVDLAANVSKLTGDHELAFRLALEAA